MTSYRQQFTSTAHHVDVNDFGAWVVSDICKTDQLLQQQLLLLLLLLLLRNRRGLLHVCLSVCDRVLVLSIST